MSLSCACGERLCIPVNLIKKINNEIQHYQKYDDPDSQAILDMLYIERSNVMRQMIKN